MSVEIRSITEEELPEFHRVPAYVFADNRPEEKRAAFNAVMRPEWTTCAFVDGRMATSFAAYPFRVRFNGAGAAMAGVTAVGTYPEFRRTGLLRRVMVQSFAEQRERGQAFAILWASMAAIYQRYGYGMATTWVSYEIDPREIVFATGAPSPGRVRILDRDDATPVMKDLYRDFARPRNLMIQRADPLWAVRLHDDPATPSRYGIYYDGEQPRGYVQFRLRRDESVGNRGQAIEVADFVALDPAAYRGLWEFFAVHDIAGKVRWSGAPADDPTPLLLIEPRELNRRTGDGLWMRVTDIANGLPQRPYGEAGRLVLRVVDELCDWNDGAFELESDGTEGRCEPVRAEPDLAMPARSLAMLVSGHWSATRLQRAGLLDAVDDKSLALADRMFATTYAPWCPDGF